MENSNIPKKGLWTDSIPEEQSTETVSYAMNASVRGSGVFNYQTQAGNTVHVQCPYDIIGSVYLSDERIVVFSTDDVNSEIGVIKDKTYTTLINANCLSFNKAHLIKANYRLVLGCEFMIYFYDNYNPDRVINIDKLDDYKTDGNWDCDKLRLQVSIEPPKIDYFTVFSSGGRLEVGKYHFAVEVLDANLNSLGFSNISKGVNIYDGSTYNTVKGEYNIEARPVDGIPKVNKSIDISISNTSGSYLRIYVITKTAGDGVTTSVYSKNELIPVNSNSTLYHFTGITEFDARESIDKVVVGNAVYEKSAAQEIIDNRLVRANLTEQTIDYSNFQRHANTYSVDLKVEKRSWKIKDFNVANSFISKSDSRYPTNYETGISNEVYALGVVFRFKQGFLSPVFHIPGRAKTESEQGVVTINTFNYEFTGHLGELGETIPVWKVQQSTYNVNNENNLAFYECVDSFYPTTKDCDGQYIFGELAGTNIRHHRMPHRGSELPLYDIENDVVNFMGFDIQKNEDYPHPDIIDHFYVRGVPGTTDFIVEDAGYIGTKVDSNRLESYLQFAPLLAENYYGGDLLSYRIDDEQLKNRLYGCITNRVMAGIPPAADYLNVDSVVRLSGDGSPKIDPETTGNEAQGEYELESAFYFFNVFEPVLFTST